MPLKLYRCTICGAEFKTKLQSPQHCEATAEAILAPPTARFMEKTDPEKNKSALVGQQKMLLQRAREHSRDVEMSDLIEMNEKELGYKNRWLTKEGKQRRKIDDL